MYKSIVHNIRYAGFVDVGGCNFAAATVKLCGKGVIPQKLILKKKNNSATNRKAVPGIFTGGYLKKPNGEILVGEDITGDNFDIYNFCSEFVVNFKTKPSENEKPLTEFLKAWNKLLRENWKEYRDDPEATIWFVSYPNGWESEKDRYRDIFIKAGFEHVCMVPESNAAMLHNLRLDESDEVALKVDRKLLAEALKICKIIVDSGSYSNDTVCIDKNGFTDSVYSYTGAHIIEMMIVCANLRFNPEKFGIQDDVVNNTQREIVCKVFEGNSELSKKLRSFLFTHARLMKEEIFQALTNTPSPEPVSKIVYLGEYFTKTYGISTYTLHVSLQMIDDLLQEYSVKEILGDKIFATLSKESQKEIGSKTWSTCYKDYSQKIVDSFPGFKAALKDESKTPLVIFTGGASGMPVVTNTLLNTFDNVSEYGYDVRKDKEPLFSILNGLAVYAEGQLRSWAIEQACWDLMNKSIVKGYPSAIEYYAEKAYEQFAVVVVKYIEDKCKELMEDAKEYWLSKDPVWENGSIRNVYHIGSVLRIVSSNVSSEQPYTAKGLIFEMLDKDFKDELVTQLFDIYGHFSLFVEGALKSRLEHGVFIHGEFNRYRLKSSDELITKMCNRILEKNELFREAVSNKLTPLKDFFSDFITSTYIWQTERGQWRKRQYNYYDIDARYKCVCSKCAKSIAEEFMVVLKDEVKNEIISDLILAARSGIDMFQSEQDWISLVQADSLT